jgi:hypothetical protein
MSLGNKMTGLNAGVVRSRGTSRLDHPDAVHTFHHKTGERVWYGLADETGPLCPEIKARRAPAACVEQKESARQNEAPESMAERSARDAG